MGNPYLRRVVQKDEAIVRAFAAVSEPGACGTVISGIESLLLFFRLPQSYSLTPFYFFFDHLLFSLLLSLCVPFFPFPTAAPVPFSLAPVPFPRARSINSPKPGKRRFLGVVALHLSQVYEALLHRRVGRGEEITPDSVHVGAPDAPALVGHLDHHVLHAEAGTTEDIRGS